MENPEEKVLVCVGHPDQMDPIGTHDHINVGTIGHVNLQRADVGRKMAHIRARLEGLGAVIVGDEEYTKLVEAQQKHGRIPEYHPESYRGRKPKKKGDKYKALRLAAFKGGK